MTRKRLAWALALVLVGGVGARLIAQAAQTATMANLVINSYLLANGIISLPVVLLDTDGEPVTDLGGGNASVGSNGASAPASSTAVGGTDGSNLQMFKVDASTLRLEVEALNVDGSGNVIATPRCLDDSKVASKNIDISTSGNNEIVALSGSTVIYVCGFNLIATGAVIAQWIVGTGTACATGETDKETLDLNADGDGIANTNAGAIQFKSPAGNALCIELSGAVGVKGRLTYVQE